MEGMRCEGLLLALPLLQVGQSGNPVEGIDRIGERLYDEFKLSTTSAHSPRLSANAYDELAAYLTRRFTHIIKVEEQAEVHQPLPGTRPDDGVELRVITLPRDADGKQQRFFAALRDAHILIRRQLRQATYSPFVCCGTALGITRDGMFIPHDEDIDVGIALEDLGSDPAETVLGILSACAMSGQFVCFDVCGGIERGLELRLQHIQTSVRVDVNIYYPPLVSADADREAKAGPFVWCATHYSASASRKHGMYRYRHDPFFHRMEHVLLRSESANMGYEEVRVLVPPVSYLEEYFGAGWRFPKKYTYEEGLAGEYKNIIDE